MRQNISHTCFLLCFIIAAGCKQSQVIPQRAQQTLEAQQLLLGNPSGATADPANFNNYLMMKPQYALSYSRDRGTPNWVSWHMHQDWFGTAPRQNDFRADTTLPEEWYRVSPSSYTGSGFDLGHNVPPADRTKTGVDYSATFLMTNMIPQAPNNNQIAWAFLEDFTRNLVHTGKEVYVIMGNYGIGGTGTNGSAQTIDKGRVTVPKRIWKVLVVLRKGEYDIDRITTDTRVIAVDIPNSNTMDMEWGTYRTSVDSIEQATGFDLLSNLPEEIEEVVEARIDDGPTK